MLFLEQVDQIRRRAHAHQALDGVEDDIELALGHGNIRGYEWEPLNLTHQPAGAVVCSPPEVPKKNTVADCHRVRFCRARWQVTVAVTLLRAPDLPTFAGCAPPGTTNSDASGSARTMLTSRYTVSPVRGSLCLVRTRTFSSGENHSSDTTLIGCRFPIAPAGIVVVVERAGCGKTLDRLGAKIFTHDLTVPGAGAASLDTLQHQRPGGRVRFGVSLRSRSTLPFEQDIAAGEGRHVALELDDVRRAVVTRHHCRIRARDGCRGPSARTHNSCPSAGRR